MKHCLCRINMFLILRRIMSKRYYIVLQWWTMSHRTDETHSTHTHIKRQFYEFSTAYTHTHTAWAFCCCFLFKRQSSIVTMCSIAHSFHSLSVWIFLRISRYCIVSISRLYSYTNVISHHNQTRSHLLHFFFSHSASFVINNYIICGNNKLMGVGGICLAFLTTA